MHKARETAMLFVANWTLQWLVRIGWCHDGISRVPSAGHCQGAAINCQRNTQWLEGHVDKWRTAWIGVSLPTAIDLRRRSIGKFEMIRQVEYCAHFTRAYSNVCGPSVVCDYCIPIEWLPPFNMETIWTPTSVGKTMHHPTVGRTLLIDSDRLPMEAFHWSL